MRTVNINGTASGKTLEELQAENRNTGSAWAVELSDGRVFDQGHNAIANPPCSVGDCVRINGVAQTSDLIVKKIAVWDALGCALGIIG